MSSWDESLLVRFGAEKGLEWKFIMASSQHQNGAAEIMIKMVKGVKKSMMRAMGNRILNLNEMNTLMAEIAQLVNERPRFLLVQAIPAQFWKIWIRDFFPAILVRHKWHVKQRNLMVNDVCLLKEEDALRSEWKLARLVDYLLTGLAM